MREPLERSQRLSGALCQDRVRQTAARITISTGWRTGLPAALIWMFFALQPVISPLTVSPIRSPLAVWRLNSLQFSAVISVREGAGRSSSGPDFIDSHAVRIGDSGTTVRTAAMERAISRRHLARATLVEAWSQAAWEKFLDMWITRFRV